jgi:hypothetical protein
MRSLFVVLCLLNSVVYLGEAKAALNSPSESSVLGAVEVRPSYKSLVGEFHSEDSALLGYQFNKNNSEAFNNVINNMINFAGLINQIQNQIQKIPKHQIQKKLIQIFLQMIFSWEMIPHYYIKIYLIKLIY